MSTHRIAQKNRKNPKSAQNSTAKTGVLYGIWSALRFIYNKKKCHFCVVTVQPLTFIVQLQTIKHFLYLLIGVIVILFRAEKLLASPTTKRACPPTNIACKPKIDITRVVLFYNTCGGFVYVWMPQWCAIIARGYLELQVIFSFQE